MAEVEIPFDQGTDKFLESYRLSSGGSSDLIIFGSSKAVVQLFSVQGLFPNVFVNPSSSGPSGGKTTIGFCS